MTPLTDKQLEAAAFALCDMRSEAPYEWMGGNQQRYEVYMESLRQRDLETIALSVGREADP